MREDDEISMALRSTQKALRRQASINSRRKGRLSEIVKARMGFQEYEQVKEGLDRVIEQGWNRRMRTEASNGKKKNGSGAGGGGNNKRKTKKSEEMVVMMDEQERMGMSESLVSALEKRQAFIESVGPIFWDDDEENDEIGGGVKKTKKKSGGGAGESQDLEKKEGEGEEEEHERMVVIGRHRPLGMPKRSIYTDLEEEDRDDWLKAVENG